MTVTKKKVNKQAHEPMSMSSRQARKHVCMQTTQVRSTQAGKAFEHVNHEGLQTHKHSKHVSRGNPKTRKQANMPSTQFSSFTKLSQKFGSFKQSKCLYIKINESRYIALFAISGSAKKLFSIVISTFIFSQYFFQ